MPLFDFYCDQCKTKFEALVNSSEKDESVPCRKCNNPKTEKQVPRFRVGGRGDLRESTLHGCHDHDLTAHDHSHGHDHGHDHKHETPDTSSSDEGSH